jgi:hypothetical protein
VCFDSDIAGPSNICADRVSLISWTSAMIASASARKLDNYLVMHAGNQLRPTFELLSDVEYSELLHFGATP